MTRDLAQWQPTLLAVAASGVRRVAGDLDSIRLEVARTTAVIDPRVNPRAWLGTAATRCNQSVDESLGVLGTTANHLDELAGALGRAADALQAQVAQVQAAEAAVHSTESGVGLFGAVAAPLGWLWFRQQQQNDLRERCADLINTDRRFGGELADFARAARALRREHQRAWLRRTPSLPTLDRPPAPGTDPESVADWWATRTPAEQIILLSGPTAALLGSLDGLPAAARDQANRCSLARRLASYDDTAASAEQRAAHAVDLTVAAELARLSAATAPVFLLLDDPERWSGKGRAAIALGDPDTARNVAFLVPGMDNSILSSLGENDDRAENLRRSAGGDTAVIAWLGYDSPDLESVPFADQAVEGAALLTGAITGVLATRGSNAPHLTIVGHSYGSTTSALASRSAAGEIDDLVLIGSPGAEAERATDLPVEPGHVWVGAASDDPVTWLGWFGRDPAETGFGGHRFSSEVTDPAVAIGDSHGHYLDESGQSLQQVGRIVAGDGAAVPVVPGRFDIPGG